MADGCSSLIVIKVYFKSIVNCLIGYIFLIFCKTKHFNSISGYAESYCIAFKNHITNL